MNLGDDDASKPVYELHRGVVETGLASEITATFERTLREVACVSGLDQRSLGRLVAAWDVPHP